MEILLKYVYQFGTALVDITNEMSPYLLLGFLFAGILFIWFPKKKVYKYLGKPNSAADIRSGKVNLSSEDFDLSKIELIINSLGYEYYGIAK